MAAAPPRQHRRPYRFLSHTADVGLRIRGETLEALFANAARALTATMVDRRRLRGTLTRDITVEAPDREALLVAWLNHLLYLYDVEGFLGRDFTITHLTPERLQARAVGDIYDPQRHIARTAVKAATYHHLDITRVPGGWQATVILDL
jgi:SHS2 domain-containing protein